MPLPSPRGKQDKEAFIAACMGDPVMNEEYPDEKQRAAVCHSKWKESRGEIEIDLTENIKRGVCPECKCMPCVCGSHHVE